MMSMTGAKMRQKMTEYQNALGDMSNEAVEYVRSIPVVKTFGQTIFTFKKFKDAIDRYGVWVIAYTKDLRTPMLFYTAAINSVFVFLIAGGLLFTQGGVTNTFLLNLMFYIIITPVISLTLTRIMFQSENAMIVDDAIQRIDSVLNLAPLSEPENPATPKDSSIAVEDVSFSYDGNKAALRHISLSIQPGQVVAFVGPSGGGKTTLASLISRFFDPQQGRIRIGGVDLRNISKQTLMNTVSFVFQDSKLIKASILDNVRMGRPQASREEVLAALKSAQCTDILEKLPDGVDTVIGTKGVYLSGSGATCKLRRICRKAAGQVESRIGENGCELSGGERQRISIARAFLKDAPIILLDEATASLDVENETLIQSALSRLIQNKTVLVTAHRMRTVAGADKIVVLSDGRVAEEGAPQNLLAQRGLFSHMVALQSESSNWIIQSENR